MTDKRTATYQHILAAAEHLFSLHGYNAVTVQDIARAVDMRNASIYYYAPRGKDDLYIAAMERMLRRHGDGLTSAISAAGPDLRARMHAIAAWFAGQPPLDLARMVHSDLPALDPAEAQRLIQHSLEALRAPIAAAIRSAVASGEVQVADPDFAAFGLIGLLQSVHNIPPQFLPTREDRVRAFQASADMLLDGWRTR